MPLLLSLLHVRYMKGLGRKCQLPESIPTSSSPKDGPLPQARGNDFRVSKTTKLSHQPLSSLVSSPYSQIQGLVPCCDSFSSVISGKRSLFAWATELKWKLSTVRLTPHITFQAVNEEPRPLMVADQVTNPQGEADSGLGKTCSRYMAIWFGRSLYPLEKIISDLSFQYPFPWNFPAPANLIFLFIQPHVLSPKPAAVDLLGDLQVPGFW